MSCNKETWTSLKKKKKKNNNKTSKDQTAQWIPNNCKDQKFIRKHEQPWSENIKYHFVCVSRVFFQDFTTVLDFIS